ncbi:MAG: hypothetical protein PVF47_12695 [Anaerolineae bacterium]|jgi:hypothetical protein
MAQAEKVLEQAPGDKDWLAVLDAFAVQAVILDTEDDAGFLQLVRSCPAWRLDLDDGRSALFVRATAT